MTKIKGIILLILPFLMVLISSQLSAQKYNYQVKLDPVELNGIGGVQSYAFARSGNDWLIVGGRLDGLHRRQPFASFDAAGNNNLIRVINPEEGTHWEASLDGLPTKVREQFHSTNMQFYQDGNDLILIGGYAYSPTIGDHITFPLVTILQVDEVIASIKAGTDIQEYIEFVEDDQAAITGGRLEKINDVFYLVGGQKFMGRYNPMGPDHGPGFVQEYTDEVRRFEIQVDPELNINWLTPWHDAIHLHRRDYNLVPHVIAGEDAMVAYSGVFQPTIDLPWLYPVVIDAEGYTPIESFSQYFNHYHSATLGIYHEAEDEMHTLFFGGIAQFYEEEGVIIQDNDVPFVNTIADVVRHADSEWTEIKLREEMPGFLGASAEFILDPNAPMYNDQIVDGEKLTDDFKSVGYIYGGINSSGKNIFWINDGSQSAATANIYRVSIRREMITSTNDLNDQTIFNKVLLYPNPSSNFVRMIMDLKHQEDLKIYFINHLGQKVLIKDLKKSQLKIGKNIIEMDELTLNSGVYEFLIQSKNEQLIRKLVVTN